MRKTGKAVIGGALAALLGTLAMVRLGGQEGSPVGFLARDRVVSLATAADASIASFSPSPDALASLVALVDPVHVRMFLAAARSEDLRFAAAISKSFEAAGNAALSADFIGVSPDLAEPAALIAENGVTAAPEVIVFWLGAEVGRMRPRPGAVVEDELAALIRQARTQIAQEMLLDNDFFRNVFHSDLPLECTRCHLARGSRE